MGCVEPSCRTGWSAGGVPPSRGNTHPLHSWFTCCVRIRSAETSDLFTVWKPRKPSEVPGGRFLLCRNLPPAKQNTAGNVSDPSRRVRRGAGGTEGPYRPSESASNARPCHGHHGGMFWAAAAAQPQLSRSAAGVVELGNRPPKKTAFSSALRLPHELQPAAGYFAGPLRHGGDGVGVGTTEPWRECPCGGYPR